jgi:hypothetical protein
VIICVEYTHYIGRDSCIAEETHPGSYSQLLFPLAL